MAHADQAASAKAARVLARMHRNANDPMNVFGEFSRKFLAYNPKEALRMAECEVETHHRKTVTILRASREFVERTTAASAANVFAFLASPEMVQTSVGGLLGPRGKAQIRVDVEGEPSTVEVVDFDRQLMISYLLTDYECAKRLDRQSQRTRLEDLPAAYPHREKTYVETRYSYPSAGALSLDADADEPGIRDGAYASPACPTEATLGFFRPAAATHTQVAASVDIDISSHEVFPNLPGGTSASALANDCTSAKQAPTWARTCTHRPRTRQQYRKRIGVPLTARPLQLDVGSTEQFPPLGST